jgi:replicative DNA helicase
MPVIALSQLSRAVESRADKKPQLSDLRESGSIEQDADMVLFLFRPDYYGFTTDAEGNSTQGISEVIIAKHRNGPTGSVQLRFINKFAKFTDLNPFDDLGEYQPIQRDNTGQGFITMPSKAFDKGDEDEVFDKF